MPEKKEIHGEYLGQKRSFGDDILGTVSLKNGSQSIEEIIGPDPERELQPGLTYRFFGLWKTHHIYGPQFRFSSFCQSVPPSKDGVVAYLCNCRGIGLVRANHIWDRYADLAIRAIKDKDPGLLAIKGITEDIIKEASEKMLSIEKTEAVTIELHDLLDGAGIPKYVRTSIIKEHGTDAANQIKANPFILMRYSGVGFNLADELFKKVGLPLDSPDRQGWCLWNMIYRDRTGSVWHDCKTLKRKLRREIGSGADFEKALKFGTDKSFYEEKNGFLAEKHVAQAERRVARNIDRLRKGISFYWGNLSEEDGLSKHQIAELQKATAGQVGILSGAPGTGKTFTLARLIGNVGSDNVAVCAPTGKAAVRITQALADSGVDLIARTIHATLKCIPGPEGFTFEHDRLNPIEADYVIVDEASMLSIELIDVLLDAIGDDTQLLLVGDPDQLPPVGVGAPLRDLIEAGIPNGHLTEIVRNDGGIVSVCHQIRKKEKFAVPQNKLAEPESNIVNINRITSVDRSLRTIIGDRTSSDVQMVVAVNKKTKFCLENINKAARSIFNPSATSGDRNIDVGDKVICGKNGMVTLESPKGEPFRVANGDIGIVKAINQDGMSIAIDEAVINVPFAGDGGITAGNFELGFAITAHRSQGSEWPVVVIFLDDSFNAKSICDRHWLYTAISRAKSECYLIGDIKTAYSMVRKSNMWARKTFLVDLLADLQWQDFMVSWETEITGKDSRNEKK